MEWLDPPYQFVHPQPEVPFDLPVVRYEVGLAQRPINDPPGFVQKPTIRFHLPSPPPPAIFQFATTSGSPETGPLNPADLLQRPYLDFTNQPLIRAVLAIYTDQLERPLSGEPQREIERLQRLLPSSSRPLTLRLTRHGRRIDTIYDVQVVED